MWTRRELKERAKAILRGNYGLTMAFPLIITVAASAAMGIASALPFAGNLAVSFLLLNPIAVSVARFVLNNREGKADIKDLIFPFEKDFGNIVVVTLMKSVFIFLWSLLFIIPGIIKAYEYYMVEYIVAENPDIAWRDALDKSKQMMDGHKMNTFILELSFLGWWLLSGITCGLVGVLYAIPYQMTTKGELYIELSGGNRNTYYTNSNGNNYNQYNNNQYNNNQYNNNQYNNNQYNNNQYSNNQNDNNQYNNVNNIGIENKDSGNNNQ